MAEAEMSKSAKRRAAKKERDAAHAESAAAAAPAPPAAAPKPTPKPKASNGAEPKAKAKAEPKPEAKSKAKAKAEPAPEAKSKAKAKAAPAPEPEPKAKAKAGAKAGAKAAAAPKAEPAPEPKQAAKAKAKGEAKSKAKATPAAPPPEEKEDKKTELIQPFQIDDGSGGDWEQSTGLSKKQEKRAQKLAIQEAAANQAKALPGKSVPGLAPDQHIPGMPLKVDQASINATLAAAAAKGQAAKAAAEAEAAEAKAKESNQSTVTLKVPEAKIGIVIGPKGAKIKAIQEKTGAKIDATGEMFTITGPPQAVSIAETAVKELIEKNYCSLLFEDFREDQVAVLPTSIPDIIGKGGVIIKAFKTELDVEVKIPEVPKTPPPGKKYKVTLAGKNENVEKAKEVLNSIVMYGYHPTTHPDQSHLEMEVPEWAYRYLIGKAGSELRHIQNNYKVKVNIPREHSACQSVVVVGLSSDCERAKTYIEKVLWNAENASKGRDKSDGAIDTWGDEEETEDWMKAYLYKR